MENQLKAQEAERSPAPLKELEAQAQMYVHQIALNYLQLGRVLTEAKQLVKHGEWAKWLSDNAPVGERTAQKMMACYQRFGTSDIYKGIDRSKLEALLALPEGTEEEFISTHDLHNMPVREVAKAVRGGDEAKQEPEDENDEAVQQALRTAAEEARRYREEAEKNRQDIEQMRGQCQEMFEQNTALRKECENAKKRADEAEQDAEEVREKYFDLRSTQAREDVQGPERMAERSDNTLISPAEYAQAVNTFIAACGMLPHAERIILGLPAAQIAEYRKTTETIRSWCDDTMSAIDTIGTEGQVV